MFHHGGPHPGLTPPPPRPLLGRLAAFALRAFARLPLSMIRAAGGAIGALAARLPVRERRVTDVNLELAFPELSAAARARLARRSLAHTGRTFAEFSAIWSWSAEKLERFVPEVEGGELLERAMRDGRGVILALPHLGAWELFGPWCSTRWPMIALYRPPRMREMEALIRAARARYGCRLVSPGSGAVRSLLRALARGELVAILPDQDAGEGSGIFVPYFGEQANTMILLPRLAARTRATVLLGYAERLPRGRGWRIRIVPASDAIYDDDLKRAASAMNDDVERCVRALPEQYLWSYKRFRIRPPGSPNPYR